MTEQQLASEKVIVSSPMSFAGSTQRIWRMTDTDNGSMKALLVTLAVVLIPMAWIGVTMWYCVFGLLLVPYRLIRRSSRKRKADEARHREQLDAITALQN